MAESSLFWTTNGTGDGVIGYTQSQLFDWLSRTFLADPTSQGVVPSYLNKLAVSGTASPLTVATGAAVVAGIPYSNSAPVSVAVTTPSVGTTGGRIVLRANYTSQVVRITKLQSADGTAAFPAITQVAGTVWDIVLCNYTITTAGVITLTDVRSFLPMAIFGGFSTATATRVQMGTATGSPATITFPVAFSATPIVFFSVSGGTFTITAGPTTSSVTITTTTAGTVNWLAIGPS
jgi:hypothetical protein